MLTSNWRRPLKSLGKDEARGLRGFRFTPNGAMFAIHAAGSIRVLETENWKTVAELRTDQAKIQDFWFHADGRTLVTITDTGVQIWGFAPGHFCGNSRVRLMFLLSLTSCHQIVAT